MSEWQDIETAPRDGSEVLVHVGKSELKPSHVAYWVEDWGWIVWGSDEIIIRVIPTHWAPLPAPPTHNPEKEE